MIDKPEENAFEPNRVRISGETEANVVALSLSLGSEEISIETRTSTVSSEQLTLPYERLESVHVVREATYTVVFETPACEYAVTNLAVERVAVRELVDYVRQQSGLRTDNHSNESTAQSQASTEAETEPETTEKSEADQVRDADDEKTELDEWTWGKTSGTD